MQNKARVEFAARFSENKASTQLAPEPPPERLAPSPGRTEGLAEVAWLLTIACVTLTSFSSLLSAGPTGACRTLSHFRSLLLVAQHSFSTCACACAPLGPPSFFARRCSHVGERAAFLHAKIQDLRGLDSRL